MAKKRPVGRPKLPKGSGKQSRLICRLLASEAAEIKAAAKRAKKTKSGWIREVLLEAARSQTTEP